jgi:anti-sigma factor (TIGR02949 family)
MLDCVDATRFIDAYIDGEFAPEDRAEMERHLAACERCRVEARRQAQWKALVRARMARPAAPYALHLRIQRALDAQSAPSSFWRRAGWRVGPAVLAAAALAALIIHIEPVARSPLLEQSVVDHLRNWPVEVPGPNPDEVGSWFRGKVDFAVRPPRLGGDARLLGGRLGQLGQRQAAYLTYAVSGNHKVTVFVFDAGGVAIDAPRQVFVRNRPVYVDVRRGYHQAVFRDEGVGYMVITDLDEPTMIDLVSRTFGPP